MRLASAALFAFVLCAACVPDNADPQPSGDAADASTSAAPDAASSYAQDASSDVDARVPIDLSASLEAMRADAGLPALGAATFDGTGALALGATGLRKAGDAARVTTADKWHLGSCTKAMTATLTALLVEEGKLAWTTTLEQAFGSDWVANMDAAYKPVTIQQLLGHRGGAPANITSDLWDPLWQPGDVQAQRKTFVQGLLSRTPAQAPGTYAYSNAGYMVVGAYLEKLTGRSWEQLMSERLFNPLKMSACGFGAQAAAGGDDQPWGHVMQSGAWSPRNTDNPKALGPAGTVHCSMQDWSRFLTEHLKGARGEKTTLGLSSASWTTLHTPLAGGDYALGWIVATRSWSKGPLFTHTGSNTMNLADVWVAPAEDRIFVSVTNAADTESFPVADGAIGWMIGKYLR